MTVWGVAMVKDEEDVIEQTLRHLYAQGLDGVLVLDNKSTDGTRGILDALAEETSGWLRVADDPEVGYWQSAKMTAAMRSVAALGADWVIPFDADEIWFHDSGRPLVDAITLDGDGASIQYATLYNHYCTGLDPETPPEVDDPFTRMGWKDPTAGVYPKVVVRAADCKKIHMGNHGADVKGASVTGTGLAIRHFPYRSVEQMIRKVRNGAAAYAAADKMNASYGDHWRRMGASLDQHGPSAIDAWFRNGFYYPAPAESGLVYDPAPVASARAAP